MISRRESHHSDMSVLTSADREHFLAYGFVRVPQAVDPHYLALWSSRVWSRLGFDAQDPTTWTEDKIHMPSAESGPVATIAPKAWQAIGELCGGHARCIDSTWSDGFIANFHHGRGQAWVPAGPAAKGWHKDGDFFRHFLDSPEQGLLTIVLWSDVIERGGPTYLIADSVAPVARYLAAHPEGVLPDGFPLRTIVDSCRDFRVATGTAGDVFLMHPFMLHASSFNPLGRARLITNPPIHLREPMRFDRLDADEHSLVEQAILRGLGVARLAFSTTAPREQVVPARVEKQRQLLEQEKRRLR